MGKETKKVFVSYSWDHPKHEKWVMDLIYKLRENGVDASFDKFETQTKTTNLDQMMIKNMKDNDYVIIVLTENYAKKADELEGGVGFETMLSLPDIRENPNKFIFTMRHQGDFKDVFPHHLRSFYAIDFSDDKSFDNKFLELLHRIEEVPMYEIPPLGEKPDLQPKKPSDYPDEKREYFLENIEIPSLKKVKEIDKDKFISKSYEEIRESFIIIFDHLRKEMPSFEYVNEEIGSKNHVFKLYIDGEQRTGLKMWLSDSFGKGINLRYGVNMNHYSGNSINEMITCKVNGKQEMVLHMTMNMFGSKEANDPKSIALEIWKNNLSHYFK